MSYTPTTASLQDRIKTSSTKILEEIRSTGLDITVEGGIEDFLGINIEQRDDGSFLHSLPQWRLAHPSPAVV